jgi:hypothetical protein
MAHVQKPDFIFWQNGRVHLNRQGHHFHTYTVSDDGKERIKDQTWDSFMNTVIFRMCGVLPPCLYAYLYRGIGTRTVAVLESSWNVMAHGDARERKWRGNWRMEWATSALHTTSEHGVSSITTADAHTSAASSRLNWRPRRFKWTRPFRRKTKYGFCACAITFQTQST